MKLFLTAAATAMALTVTAGVASAAACDKMVKSSSNSAHVTNTDKHPKGIAASLLEQARQ